MSYAVGRPAPASPRAGGGLLGRRGGELIMVIVMGLLALAALSCLALGVLRLVLWILDRRDDRIDADHRAARLVDEARAEVGQ